MDEKQLQPDQLHSLKIVQAIVPWRDLVASKFGTSHANASLELIDVVIVMLAGFFNPLVRSQRIIEALSTQEWIQRQTQVERIPRSTLSDALRRFEPEALRPLIEHLVRQVPALGRRDKDLESITMQVLAADGSYFNLAGEVAWALHNTRGRSPKPQSRVRLNMQLEIDSFTPVDCDISGADDAGEAKAFIRRLKPGVIYVVDRGFVHFGFLNAVLDRGSNFVLRLRKDNHFDVRSSAPLTERDRELNVLRDETGVLPGPRSKANADCRSFSSRPPAQTLRRVTVWDERNKCEVTLLTDLMDVPAYVIAALYRNRWQIELFFKWLKCYANCDHLISHDSKGITLQFYVAMIATLLLHIITGRRVSKYALFWLGSVASGQATFEDMQIGLARVEREKELDRARRARKRMAAKINV